MKLWGLRYHDFYKAVDLALAPMTGYRVNGVCAGYEERVGDQPLNGRDRSMYLPFLRARCGMRSATLLRICFKISGVNRVPFARQKP